MQNCRHMAVVLLHLTLILRTYNKAICYSSFTSTNSFDGRRTGADRLLYHITGVVYNAVCAVPLRQYTRLL
jgi:hypothetical protein